MFDSNTIFDVTSSLTKEEKRTAIYSNSEKPTIPSTVTHSTALESLNLNWTEKDLPEKERTKHVHRLHPYLGKFIPQLVEIFLRKYFEQGQTILDPFCGSGTTLVQANELGLNSIGYDISAFNVLLSSVKTQKYDVKRARDEILDILDKINQFTQNHDRPTLWKNDLEKPGLTTTNSEYLLNWFAPKALNELLVYNSLIHNNKYRYQDLLKLILSRSARSARLTTHYDLDFPKKPQIEPYKCYKHSRTCSPTQEAFKFIKRYSLDTIRRIEEFSLIRSDAIVKIHHSDSRLARFPKIDGIITSPPYVGLIDYHEQHAYAYHLLGLKDRRHAEIGPASEGSSISAKRQYQLNIARVFRKAVKSMKADGKLIIVAHDSADLYPEIAAMCGIEEITTVNRHVNRRTGRRSSQFFESIFVWRKP